MKNSGTAFSFALPRRGARGEALVIPVASPARPPLQALAKADALCGGAASQLLRAVTLNDETGRIVHSAASGAFARVILVGLGAGDALSAQRIRVAGARAAQWLANEKIERAGLWIDGLIGAAVAEPVSTFAGGMVEGGFRFEPHKRPARPQSAKITVTLLSSNDAYLAGKQPRLRDEAELANAVNYARWLAHEPANVLYPRALAAEARRMAQRYKLRCRVHNLSDLERLKLGGLIAVGRGSEHEPCLIELEHRGQPRSRAHLVLIGKAVTFDTGGYSLKPKEGLEALKYDKCGGAAVLGAIRAAGALKLRCNLTALVPAAENAVSGAAYRPGDIVTMMSGKTVEIISTDAEGRLILADALSYAQRRLKPTALIDVATLTGGVVVTFGRACAGLMATDDALAAALEESGRVTGERLWRLPLWDEYRDLIKGVDSDIRNSANKREAHAIVGGMFLKEFVQEGMPWAHVDIAGTATDDTKQAATGFGVRLLVDYLRRCLKA